MFAILQMEPLVLQSVESVDQPMPFPGFRCFPRFLAPLSSYFYHFRRFMIVDEIPTAPEATDPALAVNSNHCSTLDRSSSGEPKPRESLVSTQDITPIPSDVVVVRKQSAWSSLAWSPQSHHLDHSSPRGL